MSEGDFGLVEGSGNVFRDFGDPDADLKQAKAVLAARIIAVATGKKITQQTFAIVRKIKDIDTLLQRCSRARDIIREVHPEVCFWALAGRKPMTASKKKREGFCERVAVLKSVRPSVGEEVNEILNRFLRKDVDRDDILDAMVAAITASAEPAGLQTLPEHPTTDRFGLPMEMVYGR